MLKARPDVKIGHAYEPFPCVKKMRELLPVPEASCFLSLLLLPKATDGSNTRYNALEDTLARADARVATVVAGLRCALRVHERADGGAADQDLRRDGAVDREHGLAVGPGRHGERKPVGFQGLPRRGHRHIGVVWAARATRG